MRKDPRTTRHGSPIERRPTLASLLRTSALRHLRSVVRYSVVRATTVAEMPLARQRKGRPSKTGPSVKDRAVRQRQGRPSKTGPSVKDRAVRQRQGRPSKTGPSVKDRAVRQRQGVPVREGDRRPWHVQRRTLVGAAKVTGILGPGERFSLLVRFRVDGGPGSHLLVSL